MATIHVSRPQPGATMPGRFSARTAWVGRVTPLRRFVRTETGGAALLIAAVFAALAWANVGSSYQEVWETHLDVAVADRGIHLTLREWINSGLMTVFFFVVGLEARREFDLGELRERHRTPQPALTALVGIIVPVAIYLAFNAGKAGGHAWGVAMSTDTAFALGVLALVGPR